MWMKTNETKKVEEEIVNYAKKLEPTTYFHEKTASFYIFSERLTFSIKKHPTEEKYGARFGRSNEFKGSVGRAYVHAKNLFELEKKLQSKVDDYYKQRLQLAIQGKTYDMLPKLLHAAYGKSIRRKIAIKTEVPTDELTRLLKDEFTSLNIRPLEAEKVESYKLKLKSKKERGHLLSGLETKHFHLFLYKDQLDIIRKTP